MSLFTIPGSIPEDLSGIPAGTPQLQVFGMIPGDIPGDLSGLPYDPDLVNKKPVYVTTPTTYRFVCYHPLTGRQLTGNLRLVGPQWSQTVDGNGTFSARLVVPENPIIVDQFKASLEPGSSAIYVIDNKGNFVWGGPIMEQEWEHASGVVTINAVEWRSWLFWKFLSPNINSPYKDIVYSYTQKDQLLIARDLVTKAVAPGVSGGCPSIKVGTETSGSNPIPIAARRDLNVNGSDFKYVGDAIDSMAHREGGFEWTIEIRSKSDGSPQLYFVPFYPQRGMKRTTILLKHTASTGSKGNSGNILSYGPIKKSWADVRQRIWGVGSGTGSNAIWTHDTEPRLSTGNFLMSEDVWTNSSITKLSTLGKDVRKEREYRKTGNHTVSISLLISDPDVGTYNVGDRVRLILSDRWVNLDYPSVRITEKVISPQEGSGQVMLTLDLTDLRPPDTDIGGSI